jgi:lycopene beta-cyclase
VQILDVGGVAHPGIVVSLTSTRGTTIQHFDYIIIGAGCAGLSLAVRLASDSAFNDKQILLLERAPKSLNDRTWCFWENHTGYFDVMVHHRWNDLWVKHPMGEKQLDLQGYAYKMIRGIDFYRHCFKILSEAPNIKIHYGAVTNVDAAKGEVTSTDNVFKAEHIFSSVLLQQPEIQPGEFYLLQHFRVWCIETDTDFFNPEAADLMNFRTDQQHGCAFMYVLPVSKRKALVEYTLFTGEELDSHLYDEALKRFIEKELNLSQYSISEVENGVIPMTNLRFPKQDGRITFIGTAGGQTKASSGYTFQFIQKQSDAIVQDLKMKRPIYFSMPARFRFYDSVLLRVLHERKLRGADLFFQLFKTNAAPRVLRFLDNETNLWDEFCIMNSTQKSVFIPAAMAEWRR